MKLSPALFFHPLNLSAAYKKTNSTKKQVLSNNETNTQTQNSAGVSCTAAPVWFFLWLTFIDEVFWTCCNLLSETNNIWWKDLAYYFSFNCNHRLQYQCKQETSGIVLRNFCVLLQHAFLNNFADIFDFLSNTSAIVSFFLLQKHFSRISLRRFCALFKFSSIFLEKFGQVIKFWTSGLISKRYLQKIYSQS